MTRSQSAVKGYIRRAHLRRSRGFSLIELLIVLTVTVILTSLLMPALSSVHAHAERMISASRMRQIGMGMSMYAMDNGNRLPYSVLLRAQHDSQLQEMMALYIGAENRQRFAIPAGIDVGVRGFEGVGLLYSGNYIDAAEIFYCPSHTGDHPFERYQKEFDDPKDVIYGNYHYRGDIDISRRGRRVFTFERDHNLVFLTDGMRTRRDLNHRNGFHRLFGDGRVEWQADLSGRLYQMLPNLKINDPQSVLDIYSRAWEMIDNYGEREENPGEHRFN